MVTLAAAGVIYAFSRPAQSAPGAASSSQGSASNQGSGQGDSVGNKSAPPSASPTEGSTSTDTPPSPGESPTPSESAQKNHTACDGTQLTAPGSDKLSPKELRSAFEKVANNNAVSISVSWIDPRYGLLSIGAANESWPAWSTSKVPVALALTAQGRGQEYATAMSRALRNSDNDAAQTMWQALGQTNQERANAVTAILRRAGDTSTTVPATVSRAGFTIFGQTLWSTPQQASFLWALPCMKGADQVVSNMQQVSGGQRWGLGGLPGATFKGGWGPGVNRGYLVRQFGWYEGSEGKRVLIAWAVKAGSYGQGTAVLDQLAAVLR